MEVNALNNDSHSSVSVNQQPMPLVLAGHDGHDTPRTLPRRRYTTRDYSSGLASSDDNILTDQETVLSPSHSLSISITGSATEGLPHEYEVSVDTVTTSTPLTATVSNGISYTFEEIRPRNVTFRQQQRTEEGQGLLGSLLPNNNLPVLIPAFASVVAVGGFPNDSTLATPNSTISASISTPEGSHNHASIGSPGFETAMVAYSVVSQARPAQLTRLLRLVNGSEPDTTAYSGSHFTSMWTASTGTSGAIADSTRNMRSYASGSHATDQAGQAHDGRVEIAWGSMPTMGTATSESPAATSTATAEPTATSVTRQGTKQSRLNESIPNQICYAQLPYAMELQRRWREQQYFRRRFTGNGELGNASMNGSTRTVLKQEEQLSGISVTAAGVPQPLHFSANTILMKAITPGFSAVTSFGTTIPSPDGMVNPDLRTVPMSREIRLRFRMGHEMGELHPSQWTPEEIVTPFNAATMQVSSTIDAPSSALPRLHPPFPVSASAFPVASSNSVTRPLTAAPAIYLPSAPPPSSLPSLAGPESFYFPITSIDSDISSDQDTN
ncbi:hypothetical protein BX616_002559, partial [Lobosporangium transversale]